MSALKRVLTVGLVSAALILVGAGCSSSTTVDTNIPSINAGASVN